VFAVYDRPQTVVDIIRKPLKTLALLLLAQHSTPGFNLGVFSPAKITGSERQSWSNTRSHQTGARLSTSMSAAEVPESWKEYFDNLEVMVFSGSRNFANPRTVGEFEDIANQCIQQSHQELLESGELVAEVRQTLSRSPLTPWGDRLNVQGEQLSSSCTEKEPGKVSELLCLLRGPQTKSVEMGSYWIGIVRHDYTPYMTGRIFWLVDHIAGHGKIRHLLFARNHISDASSDTAREDAIWDKDKVDKFNQMIRER